VPDDKGQLNLDTIRFQVVDTAPILGPDDPLPVVDDEEIDTDERRPALHVVDAPPEASDDDIDLELARGHARVAETYRRNADRLTTRFPGNARADRVATALRADADELLQLAHELAASSGVELRQHVLQAG
jgi:hypothetical protein